MPDGVALSAWVKFCHVNFSRWVTRVVGFEFVKIILAKYSLSQWP